jgi:hypothetical protein
MARAVDRGSSLITKDNKGIICACRNSECELYNERKIRSRRENSLGICRKCGMNMVAIDNTRLKLKMEKAKEEYEKINGIGKFSITNLNRFGNDGHSSNS